MKLLVIILVVIILGLYYAPKETKTVLSSTGNAVKEGAKVAVDELKENKELKDNLSNLVKKKGG